MQKSLKQGMKALALAGGASALLAGPALASSGSPSITIRTALAPNVFSGSPSTTAWDTWRANAITAMQTGKRVVGTPNTPGQFRQTNVVNTRDMVVTGFPSWRGMADPLNAFGVAFATEMGTRPSFVWRIKPRDGRKINIANGGTSFTMTSNDVGNDLGYSDGNTSYNNRVVGILYGADGKPGGGNDTIVDSGTGYVNEIISFRPGNSEAPSPLDDVSTLANQQIALDNAVDSLRLLNITQLGVTVKFANRTATSSIKVTR